MRRWFLALALLLALALPAASRAEESEAPGGDAAPAAASEPETAGAEGDASEAAASAEGEGEESAAEESAEPGAGEEPAAEEAAEGDAGEEPAAEESAEAGEGEAEEEEDEGGFGASLLEYASNTKTQFLTGLNGLVTAPADPVMATVTPPKAFAKAGYERRPLGFGSGILQMAYRSFTGALDLALAPGPIPVLSPVPRYKLIPGFEHEDE